MAGSRKHPSGDYAVGYCRPPKAQRFPKGVSGNPKGRPKSKKSDSANVSALLDAPVKVTAGGKTQDMHPFEASVRKLAKKALKGDVSAIVRFIRLCERYEALVPPPVETGGGVIRAPKGLDFQEWFEAVTEEVPIDEE